MFFWKFKLTFSAQESEACHTSMVFPQRSLGKPISLRDQYTVMQNVDSLSPNLWPLSLGVFKLFLTLYGLAFVCIPDKSIEPMFCCPTLCQVHEMNDLPFHYDLSVFTQRLCAISTTHVPHRYGRYPCSAFSNVYWLEQCQPVTGPAPKLPLQLTSYTGVTLVWLIALTSIGTLPCTLLPGTTALTSWNSYWPMGLWWVLVLSTDTQYFPLYMLCIHGLSCELSCLLQAATLGRSRQDTMVSPDQKGIFPFEIPSLNNHITLKK